MKYLNKIDNKILIYFILIIFFVISILSIKSASLLLGSSFFSLYLKQIIWYVISSLILFTLLIKKENILTKNTNLIYYGSLLLLIYVLFFGQTINNSKGWITLFGLSFEPSEFMKVGLILKLSKELNKYKDKSGIKRILIALIYTIIPSVLVFLQPDTGNVIIYFIIFFSICFISGIHIGYFIGFILLILISLLSFFYLYNNNLDIITKVLPSNIFYRIHRILDWKGNIGFQLKNSLISVGSAYLFGHGYLNPIIYIPEAYTDFIFPVFVSIFGFTGALVLIIIYLTLFYTIYKISKNASYFNKMIIGSSLSVFVFQFTENIAMTIGLLPITGIPLPFISYGGSNLIISFLLIYLIIYSTKNISSINKRINNPK